jgi:2-furoate---CoA ligase
MANSETMASTHLALQKLGATSAPMNIRLGAGELAYCVGDAAPSVVVTDDTHGERAVRALADAAVDVPVLHAGDTDGAPGPSFEALVADQSDSDLGIPVGEDGGSVMLYTSGTTGRPKGVPRTHRNEWSASVAHVIQCRYGPGESTLGAMPMYHTMGLRSLLSMIVVGGTFVAIPAFSADAALELVAGHRISSLYLVPTAFWALQQTGRLATDARSVRRLAYAGAPMTSTLSSQLAEGLEPEVFVNHYGSSEVYTFSVEDDAGANPGCAGRPGVFSRLRVVAVDDTSDAPLSAGETGEIVAALGSPEAFAGYWQRPDADAKALRDGWYHSGDLGHVDADGNLWVSGRVDDMVITGGENVHPVEVEDVLAACPDVAEVAVVGLPDEKWGQAVTAFVVAARQGATADGIRAWAEQADDLSAYKRPKRVVLVEEIPKNPVGKILRRRLVEEWSGR